uniref:Putative nucleotidyltransferase, ribonuclease H n=1 Tax=Tanacetum cinerariifolium TaxID=118510 RepID=A0A6L2K3A1_TANCI|nr:putative nucleotidyltransferase, ribonuclease H [Tanacetum cinerariifolium]
MLTKPRSIRLDIGLYLRHCPRNKIFQTKCLVKEKICSIIDGESCENLASKALVKDFKLPPKPRHSPYQIWWIKKGMALKVTMICKVPLAIGKHYNSLVIYDVIDIETCHVLLGRTWQDDMDATHQVLKGIEDVMENAIPAVIKPLLAEFGKIMMDDAPDAFPPLRNIKHQIDLSSKTTLFMSISNEALGFNLIKELYASDEDFRNIWMELETKQHRGEFILLDGYLFKGNRLCIPKTFLRSQLNMEIHVGGLSDHFSQDKTIANIESRFYVPQLKRDVGAFVKRCDACQERKDKAQNIEEPFMMLGSGPNIIKEDFFNDLDGEHSTDGNNDDAYVVDLPNTMSISKTFNVSDIYEFHSEDVNEGKHSRTSSSKERGNDEDMIQKLAE